jgi:hypothetical protein
LDNAWTGGAALWVVARTRGRAVHLVQLMAAYDYSSLRYYGDHGVTDVQRDADQHHSRAGFEIASAQETIVAESLTS